MMTTNDKLCFVFTNNDLQTFNEILTEIGEGEYSLGTERLLLHLDKVEEFPIVNNTIKEKLKINDEQLEIIIESAIKAIEYDNPEGKKRRKESREYQELIKRRPAYLPHIWVENENTRPSSITMFGLTGGSNTYKRIFLDWDITKESEKKQLEEVKQKILAKREDRKYNSFFGKAISFIYRPFKDISYHFDYDGNFISKNIGETFESEGFVSLK